MRIGVLVVVAAALAACGPGYIGSARDVSPKQIAKEPGWTLVERVPYVAQERELECGAAAISMVVSYWTGAQIEPIVQHFRPVTERGIAAGKLRDFARARGLASYVVVGDLADLAREVEAGRPVVVGLMKPRRTDWLTHYEVVIGFHREKGLVVTLDPDQGWRQNTVEGFLMEWNPSGRVTLVVSAKPKG